MHSEIIFMHKYVNKQTDNNVRASFYNPPNVCCFVVLFYCLFVFLIFLVLYFLLRTGDVSIRKDKWVCISHCNAV